jgi:2-keto-4-pentenoate hydratase/2-oxohepta-3-ene-1,7-dioic acid hydratase in catechol pathway
MRKREMGRGFMERVGEESFQGNTFLYDHMEGNGRENLGRFGGQAHLPSFQDIDAKKLAKRITVIARDPLPPSQLHRPNGCRSISEAREKGKHLSLSLSLSLYLSDLQSPPQVIAIGRNYLDHVKELNNAAPKEPFFFLKPTSSYLPSHSPGAKLQIPRGVLAHHEGSFSLSVLIGAHEHPPVELGLVIGAPGRDIPQEDALNHIAGYSES